MAIPKEIAREILDFELGKKPKGVVRQSEDFGEIMPGVRLGFGPVTYQQRVTTFLEEPLTFATTTQFGLYLEKRENGDGRVSRTALIYSADVIAIGGELAEKVADKLKVTKARVSA